MHFCRIALAFGRCWSRVDLCVWFRKTEGSDWFFGTHSGLRIGMTCMRRSSKGDSIHGSRYSRNHETREETCKACCRSGSSYTEVPNFRYDSSFDTRCMAVNRLPSACLWCSWSGGSRFGSYLNCYRSCFPCCLPGRRTLVILTLTTGWLTRLAKSYWSGLPSAHLQALSFYRRPCSTTFIVHPQLQLSRSRSQYACDSQSLRYLKKYFWIDGLLTWSSWNLAVYAMPALSEVVLDAFQPIKCWHLLRSFVWARLSTSIVRRVLMLDSRAWCLPGWLLGSSRIWSLGSQILLALCPWNTVAGTSFLLSVAGSTLTVSLRWVLFWTLLTGMLVCAVILFATWIHDC